MKKLRKPIICVLVLVLSIMLSGCMKMHIDIIWNEDNSAELTMTIGVATYALSMMDLTEEEMQQQLRESIEEDTEIDDDEYIIEDFSDSEYTGIKVTMKIDDITKNSEDSIEHLTFTFEDVGGTKTYTVIGDFMDSDIMGNEADEFEIDSRITIVMPGRLRSHNATERSGNRLTWIQEDPNVAVSIYARSEGGGGLLWLWFVIGGVVLVGGGAVAVLFVLKKKKSSSQASTYGGGTTPSYGTPPQNYAPVQQQYQQPQQPVPQPAYQPQPPAPPAPPPQPTYEPPPAPPSAYEPPPPPPEPPPPPPPPPPTYEPPPPPPQPEPPQPPPPPAYEPPPPPTPPAPATTPKFCMNCGGALTEGTKFCPSCGTSIG